ncbi:MAG: terpene cyclase/mutase family protein [Planctomycetes bacterium]|nr:terpene cyclase/mutase family protein [Planctomycetota bacterium]MCB9916832.1 terpene cyclase/mutase family protein [Planctomycetota bacterium]
MPDASQDKLRPPGVTEAIEVSIKRGLDYLARTQNRDGSWRSAGGYGSYPVAMTALAGTALACSGSTTTRGPYAIKIRRCVDYLLRNAMGNGLITSLQEEARPMYGHGFSLVFLAEVYGIEEEVARQHQVHRVVKKAVELVARSQSAAGGWLYAPDDNGDEGSVTITQVQGLRAARNAGIAVPTKVIKAAIQYIADCQNPDGGISYSKSSRGSSRPAITGAAVAVLYNAGKYDDPMAEKALAYAKRTLPVSGGNGHHYYAHYYLAQAMYQRGGKDWDDYYGAMSKWLMRQQQSDGSWQGDGVGATYGTSVALTILQLPYANLPIYQR